MRLSTFELRYLLALLTFCVGASLVNAVDETKNTAAAANPLSETPHRPWLSGPRRKKLELRIGWALVRRVSDNADLVTIADAAELNYILSFYKPQIRHFRERQLQLGLMLSPPVGDETSSDTSSWRWVDDSDFNSTLLSWDDASTPTGDATPSDRERCALLNVNARSLSTVDCEQGGSSAHFYRFVCERTHEKHMKHEALNNPLWKQLEGILSFFGIKEKEENDGGGEVETTTQHSDYEDEAIANFFDDDDNNEGASSGDTPAESSSSTVATIAADEPATERAAKTLDDGPPRPASAVNDDTSTPTSRVDALEALADTLETTARGGESSGERRPAHGRVQQLERIVNAVQTMLESEGPHSSSEVPSSSSRPQVEVVQVVERRGHEDLASNTNQVDAGSHDEQVETALNVEGDHETAAVEAKSSSTPNSGDLLLAGREDELVGCGAKNLGGGGASSVPTSSPSSSSASTTAATPAASREDQETQLVEALRKLVHSSSSVQLRELAAAGNNSRLLVEKLRTAVESAAAREAQNARTDAQIADSLEELAAAESSELLDKSPSSADELAAIGSGVEPPSERLVTLTPVALSAHQKTKSSTSSPAASFTPPSTTATNTKTPPNDHIEESSAEAAEVESTPSTKSPSSLFPRPDFKLAKNAKLAAAAIRQRLAGRRRVDAAYDAFNQQHNATELAERVAASEAQRGSQ